MADKKNPWARGPSSSGGGSNNGGNMGGGGGKKPSPDYEQWLRDHHNKIIGKIGNDDPGRLVVLGFAAILLVWFASGVYRVNSDELGVVMRFGQYNRTTTPGLNYHLPYPIEVVKIPSVTTVNKIEIGYNGSAAENPTVRDKSSLASYAKSAGRTMDVPREGQMLTGDRNIIDIDFEVQWKIDASAPEKYLFSMRDPQSSVKAVAESAMREVIGRNNLNDILTSAQTQIAEDAKAIMQKMFDNYGAGIEIIAVNLSRPDVPQPVIDEFQDVKRAEQDKQTAESVAEGYANEILPKARGEAAKMVQDAEAYKSRVVADAEGDVARFGQIYSQYALAKDVTKRRMYLETMESVLKNMPKLIVDANARGNGGVMQYMPLPAAGKVNVPAPTLATPGATTTSDNNASAGR
jgi:membrane protease subunit HflK